MSHSLFNSPLNTPEERFEGLRELPMAINTAPEKVTTVEIRGQAYRVPAERIVKSFYRDITYMEDEELIYKYGLTPYKQRALPPPPTTSGSSKFGGRIKL
jgi:hypothetical protein